MVLKLPCPLSPSAWKRADHPVRRAPTPHYRPNLYILQVEAVRQIDEQLRLDMKEVQLKVGSFVTQQKHVADTMALDAHRQLENDKGVQSYEPEHLGRGRRH